MQRRHVVPSSFHRRKCSGSPIDCVLSPRRRIRAVAAKAALALTFTLLFASACSDQPIEIVGERTAFITNGSLYSGHPAVGRLRIGSSGLCTATLIGNKTVVTAAHCIKSGSSHTFILDSGEQIAAASVHQHPQYTGAGSSYDIAIVMLSKAPSNVEPVIPSTDAPSVGLPITLIGYGVTMCDQLGQCSNDANVKRRTTNSIAKLYQGEFRFDGSQSTCKGDSGGPAFATINGREVQIGVTSRGAMPCGTSAIDTRIDSFIDWIKQVSGGDVNDGADTTPPTVAITAPQDGATLDPGTVTVTTQASDDSGTVASVELLVDGQSAGSKSSAPFEFSVDLQQGSHTLEVLAKDGAGNEARANATVTVNPTNEPPKTEPPKTEPPSEPEPGAFGAECGGPSDCDSGLCAFDPGAGKHYCTETCDPSATPCPGQSDCMPTNNPDAHVCSAPLSATQPNQASPDGNFLVGSCAVAPRGALFAQGAWMLPLLLGLALLRLRRRRRRARRARRQS